MRALNFLLSMTLTSCQGDLIVHKMSFLFREFTALIEIDGNFEQTIRKSTTSSLLNKANSNNMWKVEFPNILLLFRILHLC